MATIGTNSKSFLRSSIYETSEPLDEADFFVKLLAKNSYGFIRDKKSILNITREKGIQYRMVFNAMNMREFDKEEIQEHLKGISDELNDLGVSGIVEFHNADGTQNSDHIHLWVSSEDKLIYNRIANYMLDNALSNEEDIHIQKYNFSGKIDDNFLNKDNIETEENYANEEERATIDEDFIAAEEYIKEKEQRMDDELQIASVPIISREERETSGERRHMLSLLPDGSLANLGNGIYTDDTMLLSSDEEEELYDAADRGFAVRLHGSSLGRMGEEGGKLADMLEALNSKTSKLEKLMDKGDALNEDDKSMKKVSLHDEFAEINAKTSELYAELHSVSKKTKKEVSSEDVEFRKMLESLRNEQTYIMRQL